jgi:hypothetical protein
MEAVSNLYDGRTRTQHNALNVHHEHHPQTIGQEMFNNATQRCGF